MSHVSRRHFLFGTLLTAAIPRGGFGSTPSLKFLGYQSPNEKMNIGAVGAGGRAIGVLGGLDTENIVAFADVDWDRGAGGFERWPNAARYKDFRAMLDKEKGIDAVTVVIPDHMHATVALDAMQRGKHVYVEKPLTRTAWEARLLTDAAAKYKVATQMGNQGYSHDATRVAAEIIWSGEIGDVTEVRSFRGCASWPQGMQTLPAPEKVPDTLDWDLWLGGAAFRRYTSGDEEYKKEFPDNRFGFYLPFNWRGFYDFGTSLIGDWGIHQLGPANLALRLGSPVSVECIRQGEGRSPYTFPQGGVAIKWEFAARENMPPVTIYWSDTGDLYTPPGMTIEEMRAIPGAGPEIESGPPRGGDRGRGGQGAAEGGRGRGRGGGQPGVEGSGYNTVFVGTKGYLGTGGRGKAKGRRAKRVKRVGVGPTRIEKSRREANSAQGVTRMYTRREFGRLALAGLPAAALLGRGESMFGAFAQAKPTSVVNGVQLGAITYSYRGMPDQSAEATLKYVVESGVNAIELMGGPVEGFAGAPAAPVRPASPQRPQAAEARGRGGADAPTAAGGAAQAATATASWNGQPCEPTRPGAPPPGGRGGRGRGQMSPEQQAAQQEYAKKLREWRTSVSMEPFKKLRQIYNDAGVSIYAWKQLNTNMSDEEVEYVFKVTEALGCTHTTVELPTDPAQLKRFGDFATKHKVYAAYHTHLQGHMTAFDQAFAASPGNMANVDFGHWVAAGNIGGSPMDFLRKHHDRISSFHLKDRTTPEHCALNLPFGKGETPIKEILQLLSTNRWKIPATIELEYAIPEGSDAVSEVQKCVEYCRRVLTS